MMTHFVFILTIISSLLHQALCFIAATSFKDYTGITDMICPSADVVFLVDAPSLISCALRCTKVTACVGVFYHATGSTCTGCNGNYNDVNALKDSPGNVYLKMVKCYEPIPSVPNVVLDPVSSNDVGTSIPYRCAPCSLYPPIGQNTVTCDANGVWSTPSCTSGPETGYLRNGDPIPAGAIGCAATYGNECGNSSINDGTNLDGGTGPCYCDTVCCNYGDCCFDVACVQA